VLLLTAREDVEGVVEGFVAGGLDYILKPFRSEEVVARLRTHLERARFARQLAEINAHLEELVAARTRQLELKVRELKGRDRIARHMLAVHPLDESLQVVLEVVAQVVEVERAAAYLLQEGKLVRAAILGEEGEGDSLAATHLSRMSQAVGAELIDSGSGAAPWAAVPVRLGGQLLGVVCASRSGATCSGASGSELALFAHHQLGPALVAAVDLHPEAVLGVGAKEADASVHVEERPLVAVVARETVEGGGEVVEVVLVRCV
jgi:hypothetical protein